MKIWNGILVFIACMFGAMAGGTKIFGLNEYKSEIIIGLLIIIAIDYGILMIYVFKKYTLLQTKYDIIFRTVNIIVGFTAIGFFIKTINHFFDFGWILLLLGFLGLTSGIVYRHSIQLRTKSSLLIVKYKHRSEKTLKDLDSVILKNDKIVLSEHDRVVEINDIKNTESNKNKIVDFFRENYPNVQLIRE